MSSPGPSGAGSGDGIIAAGSWPAGPWPGRCGAYLISAPRPTAARPTAFLPTGSVSHFGGPAAGLSLRLLPGGGANRAGSAASGGFIVRSVSSVRVSTSPPDVSVRRSRMPSSASTATSMRS